MLTPTAIRYDFPITAKLDPFDLREPETQWLLGMRAFSSAWKHTDPVALDDNEFHQRVLLPYTYGYLMEKLAVVAGGLLVREWPATDRKSTVTEGPYRLYFKTLREVSYYQDWRTVARDTTEWPAAALDDPLSLPAKDYNEAVRLALSFPPDVDEAIMVTRALEYFVWDY
ncbi:hypothetical protein ACFQ1S_19790 [Kibdelosporangium lantanae]|uniref:Uncharacterized protein n=1 Tax=Kibdelosporangium lantanae TaxID=1497396 RepID=A0ABW3MCD1_9PSEU